MVKRGYMSVSIFKPVSVFIKSKHFVLLRKSLIIKKQSYVLPVFSFLLLSIIYPGCNTDANPQIFRFEKQFGIYMLKDTSIQSHYVMWKDPATLELMNKPWLIDSDIEMYDFSTHYIYLKNDKSLLFDNPKLQYRPKPFYPFVAAVNRKACYSGSFEGFVMDYYAPVSISLVLQSLYPDDVFPIYVDRGLNGNIDNEKVKQALISAGIYHGGISVKVHDIKIKNGDTAEVNCKVTFINRDSDNLYVFDPEKGGDSVLYHLGSGLELYNPKTGKAYGPGFIKIPQPDHNEKINPDFFVLVPAGKSVTKAFKVKGYSRIDPGEYFVYMYYSGPTMISKEKRKTQFGRYWMGWIDADCENAIVE